MKKKHFFRNFFTIAGYGIVGTYVCFAFIALGLYLFLRSYLTFGVRAGGVAQQDERWAGGAWRRVVMACGCRCSTLLL